MSLSRKDEETNNLGASSVGSLRDLKLEAEPIRNPTPIQKPISSAPKEAQTKTKKKCWLLWPVAWTVFVVSVYLMEQIIEITFHLGVLVVGWLSTLPTVAVILLTLAFGSVVISLLISGLIYIPSLAVGLSENIYPSKIGVRYYFVGFFGLILNLLTIVSAIRGHLDTEPTFWLYARYIYSAIAYIVMLVAVRSLTDN